MLGSVLSSQAADTGSPVLAAHAHNFEHLSQFGPRLHASLTALGPAPSFGRAVLAHRIGQCFILGNRYDLGLASFHEAIALIARLPPTKAAERLRILALLDFASALRAGKQAQEARDYYRNALDAAGSLGDLRAQYTAADCLAEVALETDCSAEAVAHAQAALQIARALNHRRGEIGALQRLSAALEATESWSEARSCHDRVAELCEAQGDSSGAALARELSEIAGRNSVEDNQTGESVSAARQPAPAQPFDDRFTLSLREDVATDCVFASDILIELGEETSIAEWSEAPSPLDEDVCPQLPPYARTFLSDQGRVCIDVPSGEPTYEDMSGCVLMRRTHRSIALAGPVGIAWKVLAALDGVRTVRDILAELPMGQRPAARGMLDLLAATGLLDISGRPIGQFVHSATKKGVLAGGGLRSDAIMRLVTDGGYRTYADAPRVELSSIVPGNLQTFHDLTRRRRSRRDYDGREISRDELAALLSTACGVTGTMSWSDGGAERVGQAARLSLQRGPLCRRDLSRRVPHQGLGCRGLPLRGRGQLPQPGARARRQSTDHAGNSAGRAGHGRGRGNHDLPRRPVSPPRAEVRRRRLPHAGRRGGPHIANPHSRRHGARSCGAATRRRLRPASQS